MKKVLMAVVLIGVLAIGFFIWSQRTSPAGVSAGMRQYTNHGVSFLYPAHYFLEEQVSENVKRTHYSIILTEDTEENKAVREGKAPGREGPTAITIDVFQNDLDYLTAEEWIKHVSSSNYSLSVDSILTPQRVGTISGFAYRWSGLYEAKAVVVANDSFLYSFTATYLTQDDLILKDFGGILESVKFN